MKQAIIRKELHGNWEPFEFPERGRKYYVKNFSDNPAFISFANDQMESTAFKLNANMGEEFQMGFANRPYPWGLVTTLYIKGEGEIEVQSEEILVEDDWEEE